MDKDKSINIYNLWYSLIIIIFLFSEQCEYFKILDKLHIKHLLLAVAIILWFAINLKQIKYNNIEFKNIKEVKDIIKLIIILFFISIIIQVIKLEFKIYIIEEIYYLLVPVLLTFCIINSGRKINVDKIIDTFLIFGFIAYILSRLSMGVLTIKNIQTTLNLKTLLIDSVSPMGESTLSTFFSILFIYYMYKKNKIKMLFSFLGAFICFKRIATLFCIFYFILDIVLNEKDRTKKINKNIINFFILIFTILPIILRLMYTNSFAFWFYSKFGIDFNLFTMTRMDIVSAVLNSNEFINYGLGSVTNFLVLRGENGQMNMHSDILRIYIECSIIGSFALTKKLIDICQKNYYSFLIMIFIMIQMAFNPTLGAGSISLWILIYLSIFNINNKQIEQYKNNVSE